MATSLKAMIMFNLERNENMKKKTRYVVRRDIMLYDDVYLFTYCMTFKYTQTIGERESTLE
jgi:hypothetical protein